MSEKSLRIRTTPGGNDNQLIVKLDQSFDTLEILSLKIQQSNIYRSFSSDYGILVGRVIANEGLGVPNAKVSVFIPISETDAENPAITQIYPYTQITDKNDQGVRYNLLMPVNGVEVGTFPTKQQFLDSDTYLEVYKKYYKFTTVTNTSGDYMIFGVPVGQQLIHMDVNLSDIGLYSTTADTMVANGVSKGLFVSENGNYSFKGGTNLEQLPQINSQTVSANIIPLWGDLNDNTEIGITRVDFKLNLLVSPVAYFTLAVGFDPQDHKWGMYEGGNGDRINNGGGLFGDTKPGELDRLLIHPNHNGIVAYKYKNGKQLTFDATNYKIVSTDADKSKGVYMLILPCDDDKVITDEYGNLIPSNNESGIGTTGTWRIEVLANNDPNDIKNYHVQKNGGEGAKPFKVKSGHVYSLKMQMFDAFNLRDCCHHNIFNSTGEEPIFYPGDWLNGFLYFGYGDFNGKGNNYPNWLVYNGSYYNIDTRVIDVTDYIDLLVSGGSPYPYASYGLRFYTDAEMASHVTKLKGENTSFGDKYSSYEPGRSGAFNKYVFFKGLRADIDCFAAIKKYIG